ncbi:MAG: hypothetical protein FWG80_04845 [Alphaproteobacteria bacterium]|nr:hypothetical protein [Alphaproteobacteria bacterium]
MKKREDYLSPDIKLAEEHEDMVPVLSFAATGSGSLSPEHFHIPESNLFITAYYDDAHRLIFILDETPDKRTPNTLLVINPDSVDKNRKWDDILTRDYHANLETIRPKKDNKYQKLDIEYEGLDIYNQIINAHQSGTPMDDALHELSDFRNRAAARLANMRLIAANEQIRIATDTITGTETSIENLDLQIKLLKGKLSQQKSKVGKEPTKESAAKILRTSARIDAAKEKQKRAEARLRRARARLEDAIADADAARAQLAALDNNKPKVDKMSDEVKPLFTTDPDIIDESTAFKPIEFNSTPVEPVTHNPQNDGVFVPPPLTPPVINRPSTPAYESAATDAVQPAVYAPAHNETPVGNPTPPPPTHAAPPPPPTHAPAPILRPTPASGTEIPVMNVNKHRPGSMYYLMLAILIALSILTLWLYQNNVADGVPNILGTSDIVSERTDETQRNNLASAKAVSNDHTVEIEEPDIGNPFLDGDTIHNESTISSDEVWTNEETATEHVFDEEQPISSDEPEVPLISEPETYPMPEPETEYQDTLEVGNYEPSYDQPVPAEEPEILGYDESKTTEVAEHVAEIVEAESTPTIEESEKMCEDGTPPDANGCCAGEEFDPDVTSPDSPIGSCCPVDNIDNCFPPISR